VGVGGIYSPNHQKNRWWRMLSYGAPDTVRCASHVTRPLNSDRWSVGQLGPRPVRWCTRQSLFTVRCAFWRCFDFCACRRALFTFTVALQTTVGVEYPLLRWHTGQSGAPDQGCLWVVFCSFYLNPFLDFYWFVLNLWHL
jgi:hypothetical protein